MGERVADVGFMTVIRVVCMIIFIISFMYHLAVPITNIRRMMFLGQSITSFWLCFGL
ncbi:hypothetical protein TONYLAWSON77_80 [Paenibacillus phage TonyLawson77]|nr:hypothetical protein TONYLAWSON77_80 [Paenibacillus phage TonyLawson77]